MAVQYPEKEKYQMEDLREILRLLRAPDGCPWDREQTHESIRKNFIEETYEVIEAINQKNPAMLQEELGDVLMQVVFHTQMEEERGTFSFEDVTDGVCRKLIQRHPHIFGNAKADNSGEVLTNWDAIKRQSKGQKTQAESMLSVPRELPALMRADKTQHKASKIGFDWPDVQGALEKVKEELGELETAIARETPERAREELGDLFFSVVNVSRFLKADPEEALTEATDKFISRFQMVEQLAAQRGVVLGQASLETLDSFWDEAKVILESK